jgi:hypothetical protein
MRLAPAFASARDFASKFSKAAFRVRPADFFIGFIRFPDQADFRFPLSAFHFLLPVSRTLTL